MPPANCTVCGTDNTMTSLPDVANKTICTRDYSKASLTFVHGFEGADLNWVLVLSVTKSDQVLPQI